MEGRQDDKWGAWLCGVGVVCKPEELPCQGGDVPTPVTCFLKAEKQETFGTPSRESNFIRDIEDRDSYII